MAVAVIGGVFKETGNTLILPVMGWIPLVLFVIGFWFPKAPVACLDKKICTVVIT
jgi:hypothetical protein